VKLPRDLSGKQVEKALYRLGFAFENQCGSHVRLSKDHLKVIVPLHKTLVPKTLASILHQAQVTIEELMEEIR